MIERIVFTPVDKMSSGVFLYIGERCNSGAKGMIALVKTFSCCAEFVNHTIIGMTERERFRLGNKIILFKK